MRDRDLFWELLGPEHPKAEAFCRRLTGNRDEADDLYQEALLRAFRRFRTLRNRVSFRPWLYRIIVNTFKSGRRSRRFSEPSEFDRDRIDAGGNYDPSELIKARRFLERAFSVLKPAEKALITLHELDGWSIAELSRMSGKPEGTIKSKIARARKKMRKEIEKCIFREESFLTKTEAGYAVPKSKV